LTALSKFDPSRLLLLEQKLQREAERRAEIKRLEGSLTEFVRAAWSNGVDTSEYQDSWALEALCEHLEAVTKGHIKRLLINFPPRCGKTKVASICWPAWTWARQKESYHSGPRVQFFCGSYNKELSLKISNETRRLIESPWYQQRWGKRFELRSDQNAKSQFDNDKGGTRIASSVGGLLLGVGGSIILIDDPHNTEDVESEAERETSLRWWREVSSTRLNDPKQSAIVVIMQRLHEEDVTGAILDAPDADEWTHLMIPMRHDPGRHCVTVLKHDKNGEPEEVWEDPRVRDRELMWPERYGEKEVKNLETKLGPIMAAGRLQQLPQPADGGIFKPDYWQVYATEDGTVPPCTYVAASLDSAFTKDQENDPSGFNVWGVWKSPQGHTKIIVLSSWRKWLEMHGRTMERLPGEPQKAYEKRCQPEWGLVEWVEYECRRFRVNKLLIEAKASGHTVAQEMARLYRQQQYPESVELVNPGSQDKRARAISVQHLFADGMIYAPGYGDGSYRAWAESLINVMAKFRGLGDEEDNEVDAASQALRHLRDRQWAVREDERHAAEQGMRSKSQKPAQPLYPS
jgi:hypothetical protein